MCVLVSQEDARERVGIGHAIGKFFINSIENGGGGGGHEGERKREGGSL